MDGAGGRGAEGRARGPARELVERVGRRARAALLAEAWCRTLAMVLAAVFVLVLVDFVFRLPRAVRVLHLGALGYGGYVVVRRVLLPAVRFRPREAEIALRIEQASDGARARHRLASGLELGSDRESGGTSGRGGEGLAAAMSREAARGADAVATDLGGTRFVSTRAAGRAGLVLGATLLVVSGVGLFRPQLAGVGLARTLWPFAGTAWPKRTVVADATGIGMHPIGEALPMRAVLTRTHLSPGNTEVVAFYRVISDGEAGARQRVVLTSQQRREAVGEAEGELFERLIEPAGALVEGDEIEYWFETEDNRTETARVRLAERPRVTRISATVTPPAYAESVRGSFLAVEDAAVSRDSGGVAVVQPVLAGSSYAIRLTTNKPSTVAAEADEREASEGAVDGGPLPEGWTREDARTLVYTGVAAERTRIDVELLDEDGLLSTEPVAVVLQVTSDAPAAVTITEPPYDESVLATASVGVRAEARDDLGMRWLALERQSAAVPAGSEGAAAEGAADVVRVGEAESAAGEVALTVDTALDLASIGVRAGDEVWLTAVGRDIFAAAEDPEADPRVVRSAVRRLRIIDEASFVGQIQGELAGVRRAAIEIDAAQAEVGAEESGEEDAGRARAERQASLTDRLDAQRGAIGRLGDRTERNGLDDETLTGMLDDAAALLREATEASEEATSALERRGESPESAFEAEASQAEVRENLASLISMLDQGQDNWVARRTVEGLLAEQRELAADTQALGDQTMGRSREQLSPEELTELERIAERQRDAAERARRALDSLAERAEALERFDAAQAGAMSQAARRGRQERVEQQMREAASQVDQNQTRAAAQGQQAAAEALEQMLEDIDSADEARDEALRRVLAGVLESLESLIDEQEAQIDALAMGQDEGALPALADPMVRLAGNTLGLLDEIGAQRDLASVASLVGLAADAQERAVVALREGSRDSADDAERESLSKLQDARMEAERLEEQAEDRESARKRAELRTAYRELLEQQVAIVMDTEPLVGVEIDRRTRAQVRALGQRQGGVGESLESVREATEGLAEATVFDLAHRRIGNASGLAEDALLGGTADTEVLRRQASIVRLLQSLLAALAEDNQPQRGGEQQAGGGGGGGSGGESPIVPEIAELKLLRAMQAEAMEWTRNLDEAGRRPLPTELRELADLQSELAGRAAELVEKLTQGQQRPGGDGGANP